MKEAILAGLISGLISPIFLSWLQHRYIWRSQKRMEIRYSIFNDALRALSLYAVDALDLTLQSEKKTYKGVSRKTEFRPETLELLEKSLGMVKAFFSHASYAAFEQALRTKLSIENVPNIEFEEARTVAIVKMSEELGITGVDWWGSVTKRFSRSRELRRDTVHGRKSSNRKKKARR